MKLPRILKRDYMQTAVMIIAVILPTLGVAMLIVLSSFINFQLSLTILMFVAFMLGFVQFMFLSLIKFSRPAIEL